MSIASACGNSENNEIDSARNKADRRGFPALHPRGAKDPACLSRLTTVRGDVAIIGMACIFPGAPDLRAYWRNILSKTDAVIDVPPGRWDSGLYFSEDANDINKVYCKRGGYLDECMNFDPLRHGVMPLGVEGGEPDQFLVLQVVQEALEDAGYGDNGLLSLNAGSHHPASGRQNPESGRQEAADSARHPGKSQKRQQAPGNQKTEFILGRGNYLGVGASNLIQRSIVTEQTLQILKSLHPEYTKEDLAGIRRELLAGLPRFSADSAPAFIPNLTTGRVANRLDFMGPNFTVDAACASSLIATEIGVNDLLTGKCDLAITGGVHIFANVPFLLIFCAFQAMSLSSRIRPFDQDADGTLPGEGVGVVVLKRLADAERDGNRIYAVIKGIGTASDGRAVSVVAPRLEGEELALRRAYEIAGVSPRTVRLIEAHGVGTPVGDVIEVQAMRRVFGERGRSGPRCALGTVKSMIGHAMPAAGIAGLIKASLSLYHKVLPPTINCEKVNPKLEIEKTPFYVNTETRPWIHGEKDFPRRAGVNAFGFGGINAHAVLEEYTGSRRAKGRSQKPGVRSQKPQAGLQPPGSAPQRQMEPDSFLTEPGRNQPMESASLESTPSQWETEVCIFGGESRPELIRQVQGVQRFLKLSPHALKDQKTLLRDVAFSLSQALEQGQKAHDLHGQNKDNRSHDGHAPFTGAKGSELSLKTASGESPARPFRLAVVAATIEDLQRKLDYAQRRLSDPACQQIRDVQGIYFFATPFSKEGKIAFLFPGEGSQYVNMLADLCIYFPEVRACFDRTDRILGEQSQVDACSHPSQSHPQEDSGKPLPDDLIYEESGNPEADGDLPSFNIFPPPSFSSLDRVAAADRLFRMDRATEAVLTGNLAMHTLLTSLGIRPDQMAGHSAGEWSAMVFSGIIDADEFLHNTGRLNRIYRKLSLDPDIPKATLIAVGAGLSQITPILGQLHGITSNTAAVTPCSGIGREGSLHHGGAGGFQPGNDEHPKVNRSMQNQTLLYVADDNCPHQVVIAGEEQAAEEAVRLLRAAGIQFEKLPFNRGYHTPLFAPICQHLREYFSSFSLSSPQVEVYSCTTMTPYPKETEEILELAVKTWVMPVAFRQTILNMYDSGTRIFIEVGPRGNLTAFVEDILRGKKHLAIASNVLRRSGITQLNHLVGLLSAQGVGLNLGYLYRYRSPRLITWAEDAGSEDMADEHDCLTPEGDTGIRRKSSANEGKIRKQVSKSTPKGVELKLPLGLYSLTVKERKAKSSANQMESADGKKVHADGKRMQDTPERQMLDAGHRMPDTESGQPVAGTRHPENPIQEPGFGRPHPETRPQYPKTVASDGFRAADVPRSFPESKNLCPAPSGFVMQEYLKTMGRFLDTQKEMMNAYLQQKGKLWQAGIPARQAPSFSDQMKDTGYPVPDPRNHLPEPQNQHSAASSLHPPEAGIQLPAAAGREHPFASEQPSYDSIQHQETSHQLPAASIPDQPPGTQAPAPGLWNTELSITDPESSTPKTDEQPQYGQASANAMTEGELTRIMLELISEKTGYPIEMIDVNLDMESDLGIDSIKRVEIIGSFRSQYAQLEEDDIEAISSLKTIRQIIDFLGKKMETAAQPAEGAAADAQESMAGQQSSNPKPPGAITQAPESSSLQSKSGFQTPAAEKRRDGVLPFTGTVTDLKPGKSVTLLRQVDLSEDLFLDDHRFGQKISELDDSLGALPVVPMTVSIEIMAEAASLLFPGQKLIRAERIGASQWICLEKEEPVTLSIKAEVTAPGEALVQIGIIRSGLQEKPRQQVVSGRMIFGQAYPSPPSLAEFILQDERVPSHTAEQVYSEHRMFHGPRFQGIASMDSVGRNGLKAHLKTSPASFLPKMEDASGEIASYGTLGSGFFRSWPVPRLLTDPFLLDAAGQLVGYWPVEYLDSGFVIFPIALEALCIYGDTPPPLSCLRTRMRLREVTNTQVRADLDILNDDGQVWMQLIGWEDWRFYWSRQLYDFWRFPNRGFIGQITELQVKATGYGAEYIQGTKADQGTKALSISLIQQFWRGEADMFRDVMAYMILSRREREIYHRLPSVKEQGNWLLERMVVKDVIRNFLEKHGQGVNHHARQEAIAYARQGDAEYSPAGIEVSASDHGKDFYPADISIGENDRGQPAGEGKWVHEVCEVPSFSFAHTDNAAVAVAAGAGLAVGVSIGSLNDGCRMPDAGRSAPVTETDGALVAGSRLKAAGSKTKNPCTFLTPEEVALLSGLSDRSRLAEIAMRIRCAKEAVIRALGRRGEGRDIIVQEFDLHTGGMKVSLEGGHEFHSVNAPRAAGMEDGKVEETGKRPIRVHTALEREYIIAIAIIEKQRVKEPG
ncbi:MAG: beta-ketoacyl synthase N-terminal-like domain-containing protein [bacterium]